MMWPSSNHAPALLAGAAIAVGIAFLSGVKVGRAQQVPVEVPRVVVVTPAPVQPSASPAVATATAASKARVVIERPVAPPGWVPPPSWPSSEPGAAPSTWPVERIVIETDGAAAAAAPVVTPAPPAVVVVGGAGEGGPAAALPLGATTGTFPGAVAVDWQLAAVDVGGLVPLPGLEGLRIGASVVANHRMAGVGGNASLNALHPRLYCQVGAHAPYSLPLQPAPHVGFGLRF